MQSLKSNRNSKTLWFLFAASALCVTFTIINSKVLFIQAATANKDFSFRWFESACVLRGINPFDIISGARDITSLPFSVPAWLHDRQTLSVAGSVPWAYLVGLVLDFGFLPWEQALMAKSILWPCIMVILTFLICFEVKKQAGWAIAGFFGLLIVSGIPVFYGYVIGNYGFILSLGVIYACLIAEKHPASAGLIFALCAIKPQLAGLFLLVLLMYKPIQTIFSSLIGIVLPWIVVSCMVKENPISLLLMMAGQGENAYDEGCPYGLFSAFQRVGILSRMKCLLISTVVCIGLVVAYRFARKAELSVCSFFAAGILAQSWFYLNAIDRTVSLVAVLCLFVWYAKEKNAGGTVRDKHKFRFVVLGTESFLLHVVIATNYGVYYSMADPTFSDYILLVLSDNFVQIAWIAWGIGVVLWKLAETKHIPRVVVWFFDFILVLIMCLGLWLRVCGLLI